MHNRSDAWKVIKMREFYTKYHEIVLFRIYYMGN